MRMKKKAQSDGVAIATLVLLTGLFILVYLILIPPAEREALLKGEGNVSRESGVSRGLLLSESPGIVTLASSGTVKKNIANIYLSSGIDRDITTIATSAYVSKTAFSDNPKTYYFNINNLDQLDSASLLFVVKNFRGNLVVKLNNNDIFEGEVNANDLPIELPKTNLGKNNKLEFSTSVNYFVKNYYELGDVQLIKKVKVENKQFVVPVTLTGSERNNLKRTTLKYFVNCINPSTTPDILKITVNKKPVSNTYIRCDAGVSNIDISNSDLFTGTNELQFSIDKGTYSIEGAQFVLETSAADYPKYSFDVSDNDFDKLDGGNLDATLKIKFRGSGNKKLSVTINEDEISIDTDKLDYERVITRHIKNGANTVKIIPRIDNLDISKLEIFLE